LFHRELGKILRSIREGRERSLRDVSTAAPISPTFLFEVERGEKEISSGKLRQVCEALGVPQSEVVRRTARLIAVAEEAAKISVENSACVPENPANAFRKGMMEGGFQEDLLQYALGAILRSTRKSQEPNLSEFSPTIPVSVSHLCEVENGENRASSEIFALICKALDVLQSDVLFKTADLMAEFEAGDSSADQS